MLSATSRRNAVLHGLHCNRRAVSQNEGYLLALPDREFADRLEILPAHLGAVQSRAFVTCGLS